MSGNSYCQANRQSRLSESISYRAKGVGTPWAQGSALQFLHERHLP